MSTLSQAAIEAVEPPQGAVRSTVDQLEEFYSRPMDAVLADPQLPRQHQRLLTELESGRLRAAEPTYETAPGWRAVAWVKAAILVGFRAFTTQEQPGLLGPAFDKAAYPPRVFETSHRVRLVPGGSTIRRGAHLAPGVVVMPPSYVNVGAWINSGTMVDSHVLVGSCAQVGKDVHLSAGVQIGGVLEPPGSRPVIVEDGAFLGAQSGVFEGVVVGKRAVLAPGVQLTASTRVFDLQLERTWVGQIPAGGVVVPGSRPAAGAWASERGLSLYAPILVKYRGASTDSAVALEEALR